MREIWKPICGYENKYMVSNLGNVLSLNYSGTRKSKVLTPVKQHKGYLFVHLGGNKIKMVHSLVAEAFIPNPERKGFVNHIDGNKHNNSVDNLEWVTAKENVEHAIRTGLRDPHKNNHPKGKNVVNSRAVDQYSKDGQFVKHWDCISDAARAVGTTASQICGCACGRLLTAHGFTWRYSYKSSV